MSRQTWRHLKLRTLENSLMPHLAVAPVDLTQVDEVLLANHLAPWIQDRIDAAVDAALQLEREVVGYNKDAPPPTVGGGGTDIR